MECGAPPRESQQSSGRYRWKLLFGLVGAVLPNRKEKKEFVDAWEARAGEMVFGESSTYPPPGLYEAWMRERRETGESASDWLDRAIGFAPRSGRLWTPGTPLPPSPLDPPHWMGQTVPLFSADESVSGMTGPLPTGLRFGNSVLPWSDVERVHWTRGGVVFHIRPGIQTDSPSGEFFPVHAIRVSDLGDAESAWKDFISKLGLDSSTSTT